MACGLDGVIHLESPAARAIAIETYFPLDLSCFSVFREDGPHRLLFIEKLVDDRTEMGTSYYELLSHIARQQSK